MKQIMKLRRLQMTNKSIITPHIHTHEFFDENDNYKRIGIGWLHNQAFCEYQLYLKWVKGVEDVEDENTINGTNAHLSKEIETNITSPQKGIKPIESPELSYRDAKDKGISFYATEFSVECDIMLGVIDDLMITPKNVIITDYKRLPPNHYPWLDDRRQIGGYCYCFKHEYPNILLPIKSIIADELTGEPFWEHDYNEQDEREIAETTQRILDIVNCKRLAVATENKNKCRGCRFNSECDKCKN